MSKKSNPTLIGAFVVGAIALLVAAVALFGGSEYFAKRLQYVAYFEDSTKGLRVGSNVTLNGVKVGYVSEIILLVDQSTYQTLTQVKLEILPESLVVTDFGEIVNTMARRTPLGQKEMVEEAGLRAQLETESFVTGQLVVQLDMRPETQAIYRGVDSPFQEIPTIPSNVQAFLIKVRAFAEKVADDFDMEEISKRLNNIMVGVEELSNSQDLRDSLAGLNQIINAAETQQLTATVNKTLNDLSLAAADARTLLETANTEVSDLAVDLEPALKVLAGAITEAQQTLLAAKELMRGETVQAYQISETLEELQRAAETFRDFFDYLERNPDSLIRGRNQE